MIKHNIRCYINDKGVKHSHLGYEYLEYAILIYMDEPCSFSTITHVYLKVANKYCTTQSNVERGIRYAIGNKTTNKEFILRAVHDLSML